MAMRDLVQLTGPIRRAPHSESHRHALDQRLSDLRSAIWRHHIHLGRILNLAETVPGLMAHVRMLAAAVGAVHGGKAARPRLMPRPPGRSMTTANELPGSAGWLLTIPAHQPVTAQALAAAGLPAGPLAGVRLNWSG